MGGSSNVATRTVLPAPVMLLACGSFNPITTMHLRMMELAREKLERTWSRPPPHVGSRATWSNLSEPCNQSTLSVTSHDCACLAPSQATCQVVVGGIFSPVSDGYGKVNLAPSTTRVELARLACQFSSDWLAADPWEAEQPTWTRTRLVVENLQSRLNSIRMKLAADEGYSFLLKSDAPHENHSDSSSHEHPSKILPGLASDSWLLGCLSRVISKGPPCCCSRCPVDPSSRSLQSTGNVYCPPIRVKLVIGADVLQSFATPNLWSDDDIETLIRDYGIVCISRRGFDPARFIYSNELLRKYEDNIVLATEWCDNSLSATLVRSNLKFGSSVRYLVPDAVLEKIYADGLYDAKRPREFIKGKPD